MQLSENFNLSEFIRSRTAATYGIDMTPPPAVIDNLKHLVVDTLQPIRDFLGHPVVPTSGYRPAALNCVIGGAMRRVGIRRVAVNLDLDYRVRGAANTRLQIPDWQENNSAHMYGLAVDFYVIGLSPKEVAQVVIDSGIGFKQLIVEFDQWVHLAVHPIGWAEQDNSQQILSRVEGKAGYLPGIQVAPDIEVTT